MMNLLDVLLACDNISIDDIVNVRIVNSEIEVDTHTVDWWIDHMMYGMQFKVKSFDLLKDGSCNFVVEGDL